MAAQLVGPPERAFSPEKTVYSRVISLEGTALLLCVGSGHAGGVTRPRHSRAADRYAWVNRAALTPAEARMWTFLKGTQTGVRFRRQVPIGAFIADFASLQIRLVIEVDDTSHQWRDESERTAYFQSVGFLILRFTNREVAFEFHQVHATVVWWVAALRRGQHPQTRDPAR